MQPIWMLTQLSSDRVCGEQIVKSEDVSISTPSFRFFLSFFKFPFYGWQFYVCLAKDHSKWKIVQLKQIRKLSCVFEQKDAGCWWHLCQAMYGYVPLEGFFKIIFLFSIHTDVVSCKHWLASGSNESIIHVHDLNSILGTIVFSSTCRWRRLMCSVSLFSHTCCVSFLSRMSSCPQLLHGSKNQSFEKCCLLLLSTLTWKAVLGHLLCLTGFYWSRLCWFLPFAAAVEIQCCYCFLIWIYLLVSTCKLLKVTRNKIKER